MVIAVPVVAGVVRRQRLIVAQFRTAGATSPERATSTAALGVQEGMAFRILRRHEILRDVGERCYLDEQRWEEHRARRRRLAVIIPSVVVLVAAVTLWIALG